MEKITVKNNFKLITAYVNGTLDIRDYSKVEMLIGEDERARSLFEEKKQEKDFVQQLVPEKKIPINSLNILKEELAAISDDVFIQEKKLLDKVKSFLDRPLFEF